MECGRDSLCLNAKYVEREVEYNVDEVAQCAAGASSTDAGSDGGHWVGSGYTTHEMVGIGGKVKRKLKEQVKVGAAVKEYEDERDSGKFLTREQSGENRGWCSWCERVVPGKKDIDLAGKSSESVASSTASASSQA